MADHVQVTPNQGILCGGLTQAKQVADHDKALFEEFRDLIEEKVRAEFQVPKDFKIEPAKVRTQVVAGTNYYFHVRIPNGQFAHVRIFRPLQCHALEHTDRSKLVTVEKETTAE